MTIGRETLFRVFNYTVYSFLAISVWLLAFFSIEMNVRKWQQEEAAEPS